MKLNTNILYVLLTLGILLFVYSLYQRIPNIDDAWIGEQVFWLAEEGVVKNMLMKNYSDNQNGLLAYHKAFVYSGLWAVQLFGFGLWVIKSVSLFYLLVFFGAFYYYLVKLKKLISLKQFGFVAILLLIEPHIFEYSFVFRPEIMLMLTGFLSFAFLEHSFNTDKNKTLFVLLSAIFAGLSVLVHLNGAVFVLAGGLILLFKKQFKNLLWFALLNMVFVFLYFSHLNSLSDVSIWFHHLMAYDSGKSEVGFGFNTLVNILLKPFEEHLRYFHSTKEIALTLLLLTALFFGFKAIKKEIPLLLPYTLILVIALGFIAPGKTAKYLIPFIPFFSLILVLFIKETWQMASQKHILIPKTKEAISMFIVLILFVAVSFSYDGYLSIKKFTPKTTHAITEQFVKKPTEETIILAPMTFIFDEIYNYKEIIGLMSFNERAKTNAKIKSPSFFEITKKENIDYILINKHYIEKFNLGKLKVGDVAWNYKVVGKMNELTVLELE